MASNGDVSSTDGLDFSSPTSSPATSPTPSDEVPSIMPPPKQQLQFPSYKPQLPGMTSSSTPLGSLNAARRPLPQPTLSSNNLPPEMQAKLKAFHLTRQGSSAPKPGMPTNNSAAVPHSPAPQMPSSPSTGPFRPPAVPGNFRMPPAGSGFVPSAAATARAPPPKMSLAEKRGILAGGGFPGNVPVGPLAGRPAGPPQPGAKRKPGLKLSDMNNASDANQADSSNNSANGASLLDKYSHMINKETGSLTFKGKAVLTNKGVEFEGGKTFNISLDEVEQLDELGKGNYGTVYKVRHTKPRMRRVGQGLAGTKALPLQQPLSSSHSPTATEATEDDLAASKGQGNTSGVVMAMKEMRLELEDAKFATIIMELDVLHKCVSPFIVDFYGAFFQEGAVYICMEFMDGGSIDKLYGDGIDEPVLRKMTTSTIMGLKYLKEVHNIIHRDVKPTNILVNTRGQVKICDFGVSGNLVASIAKTKIGCQSYMAPERISSGGMAAAGDGGTYSVQSDIWSLGLTIIECALGRYPYPPETYDNIFSQLSAIVDGDPPDLPEDRFSEEARDFVRGCLMKIPRLRPTYPMLLQHTWLAPLLKPPTIAEEDEEAAEVAAAAGKAIPTPDLEEVSEFDATADKEVAEWVKGALERRRNGTMAKKPPPALHAAPREAVQSQMESR